MTGYSARFLVFLRGLFLVLLIFMSPYFGVHSTLAQQVENETTDYSEHSSEHLAELAAKGDMHAVFTQAYNLIFDDGGLKPDANFDEAIPLFQKAHDNGHDTANSFLTLFYLGDFGHDPNIVKAEAIAIEAAERGSGIAQLNYSLRYISDPNQAKANRAFKYLKSASVNNTTKEHALPALIETLYGLNDDSFKDYAEARNQALQCVSTIPGESFCHYILGRDYKQGWGGDVDPAKSTHHYIKSAEFGDMRAQWIIGMQYLNGNEVEKDEEAAFEWVKASADQGYVDGQISLAVMYALGQGTERNVDAAFKTYELAARQQNTHALRGLSAMYCSGEAPTKDRDLCAAGLILAFELNEEMAGPLLNHFFEIKNREQVESLKKQTAIARETLIRRYELEL